MGLMPPKSGAFRNPYVDMRSDECDLLEEALNYLSPGSEYVAVAREILAILHGDPNPAAWRLLDTRLEEYNWLHAYPNLAADMLALWYALGDLTTAFRWLAHAGLDVDCKAGLVGTVLGVMHGAPEQWVAPLGDLSATYLCGKERLSIGELAARTTHLARQ